MTLPRHIQEGADKARQLQEDLIQGKTEKAPETPAEDVFKEDAAEVQDVETGDQVDNEDEKPSQEEKEEKPSESPEKPKEDDVEHWKQKFRTLEGKYNAEVPRYAAEVRQLKQEILNLQNMFQQQKSQVKPEDAPEMGDLNPEDYDDYGDDMKKLASTVNRLNAVIKKLSDDNNKLRDQVTTVYQDTENTSFNAFLDKVRSAYPAFDAQDRDPEFIEWVNNMGIDLGAIGKSRDVNKAVEVYKAFSRITGKYQPETPPPPPVPSKERIEKQVAPPKSRPIPPQDGKKKQWTRADVDQVYRDIKDGVYNEKEAYKLKQEIFNAQRDGRIL